MSACLQLNYTLAQPCVFQNVGRFQKFKSKFRQQRKPVNQKQSSIILSFAVVPRLCCWRVMMRTAAPIANGGRGGCDAENVVETIAPTPVENLGAF